MVDNGGDWNGQQLPCGAAQQLSKNKGHTSGGSVDCRVKCVETDDSSSREERREVREICLPFVVYSSSQRLTKSHELHE